MYFNTNGNAEEVLINRVNDGDLIYVRQSSDVNVNRDPTSANLFQDLNTFLLVSYIVGLIRFLVIIIKFALYVPYIHQNTPKNTFREHLLCGVYTIAATSSLTSILVPRALLFCEAVSIVTFAFCSYQFFCLCVDYTGGESSFIRIADANMRTPPFCCCCCFINPMPMSKFTKIRLMILQLPIVIGLIYFMLNVIYLEDSALFNDISFYLMPFILTGVWGLQISSRIFSPLFLEFKIMPKYIAVQLVLLICKLQPLIAQVEYTING